MASFVVDLVQSIFTPGPTSSLLLATNVSFAALQVVLLSLLIATHSIHFVVLSALCGGLWWSINWFVAELKAQEAFDKEKKEKEKEAKAQDSSECDTDAPTVVEEVKRSSSKEVEVLPPSPGLVDRAPKVESSQEIRGSEVSTEDEWEKVSETEKDK